MRYIHIYLADLVLVESSSVVAQWCNHVVVTPRMSKLWMGSGGYIECCRPAVHPCSCQPTPDHPSMGIPALHNVRAAWSDSPSTLSQLCWSTDQLLFKMIRFRWGKVPEDVKKVTMTWHHNNITAIPDWAQKDKVANNGGFGKSEFHSHGNWILMARSSKNWQTHSIGKFRKR